MKHKPTRPIGYDENVDTPNIKEIAKEELDANREMIERIPLEDTPDNVEEFYQHMLKSTPVLDKFERASLKLKHQELVTKARADGYTQGRVDEAKTCEGCSKERAEAIRMVERERCAELTLKYLQKVDPDNELRGEEVMDAIKSPNP